VTDSDPIQPIAERTSHVESPKLSTRCEKNAKSKLQQKVRCTLVRLNDQLLKDFDGNYSVNIVDLEDEEQLFSSDSKQAQSA